jgi:glycerophosphoryl diester phosphodiesterase
VIHDDTFTRTACTAVLCDGSAPPRDQAQIRDMTLAEVQALDAGYWFRPGTYSKDFDLPDSAFPFHGIASGQKAPPAGYTATDFRIPTLPEVFDAFPNTPINIEIKMPKSYDPVNPYGTCGDGDPGLPHTELCDDLDLTEPTTAALAALLNGPYANRRDVIVVSFAQEPVADFHAQAPSVHLAPAVADVVSFITGNPLDPDVVAFQIPPLYNGLPAAQILVKEQAVQSQGYAVHIWTNSDYDETFPGYKDMVDLGVDGIMTSSPRNLNNFLCQEGIPHPDGSPRCLFKKPKKCKRKKGKGKAKGKAGASAKKKAKGKKKRKCKRKKKRKKGKRK